MKDRPFISFIAPVYNVEKYLPQCVDSLLGQTYKNLEFIFVDDCSTDKSYDILLNYQKIDSRIKVFKLDKNSKQGAARNFGIKQSAGTYISFIDSDDWIDKSFANDVYHAATSADADYIRGGAVDWYSEDSQIIEPYNYAQFTIQKDRNALLQDVCIRGGRMWGGAIRRNIIIDNDLWFPEQVVYEDNPVGVFHYFLSPKIVYLNKNYYYYRCSNQSTTRGQDLKKISDRIYTSGLLLENAKRLNLYTQYKDLFDCAYTKLMISTAALLLIHIRPVPIKQIKTVYKSLYLMNKNWKSNPFFKSIPMNITRFYLIYCLPLCVPFFSYAVILIIDIVKRLRHR